MQAKLLSLSHKGFQEVFALRQKLTSQFFNVLFKQSSENNIRVGFIINKSNVRLSVNRNRIKRALKAELRLNRTSLVGVHLVVLVKNDTGMLDSKKLRQCLSDLLQSLACCQKK